MKTIDGLRTLDDGKTAGIKKETDKNIKITLSK